MDRRTTEFKLPMPRQMLAIMLCIGLIQIAIYYLLGSLVRPDGGFAIGQPDTLLYCQAARRIVEGAPFSFSAGTAASTGTTSVLYPFILAVPVLLGFDGESLICAGFLLNATFYLVFLTGWGLLIGEVFRERALVRTTAGLLIAAFGPCAFCALTQTDIGLWMAVSAFLAWGLFMGRRCVYAPLLLLGPWLRPEGMALVVVFCMVLLGVTWRDRSGHASDWVIGILGVASILGVFALNWLLTGEAQFASVANKGHGTLLPPLQALYATAVDGLSLAGAYLFGISKSAPRSLMFVPVLGALCLWLAVGTRNWRVTSWREIVWYLSVMVSFGLVASSGMQDINLDRYLSWTFPLLLVLVAEGCGAFAEKFGQEALAWRMAGLNCLFIVAMAIVFAGLFGAASEKSDRHRAFAEQCERTMAPGGSVGLWGHAGVAYEFSSRRIAHLSGVYSPEFRTKTSVAAIEILKREPKTRFDYFFWESPDCPSLFGGIERALFAEQLEVGPDGFELRRSNWKALDAAEIPPQIPVPGVELCDRLDVGYEKEEKSHDYNLLSRYHMPDFEPFLQSGSLAGREIVEGGRFVFGGDEMCVSACPGKDLYVVMRTYPRQKVVPTREISPRPMDYAFKPSLELLLRIDDRDVGVVRVAISTNSFSDVSFRIPGGAIATSCPRVSIHGGHIACGYWFYQ